MKRGFKILCLCQLCFFVVGLQARAGNNDGELKRYNECMSQSRMHPENGIEIARTWLAEGDFSAAKHCLATGKFFPVLMKPQQLYSKTSLQRMMILPTNFGPSFFHKRATQDC